MNYRFGAFPNEGHRQFDYHRKDNIVPKFSPTNMCHKGPSCILDYRLGNGVTYATATKLQEGFTTRKGQIRRFLIGILENRGFRDTFSTLLRLQNSPYRQGLNRILLLCTKRLLLLPEYKTVSFTVILSGQYAGHNNVEALKVNGSCNSIHTLRCEFTSPIKTLV